MEFAIDVQNVTKKYKLYKNNKERLLDFITPINYGEDFYALNDVNFQAKKGETIGFVGINGSGKSTLLNIISGVLPETSGQVQINGQVSLISVSSGFKGTLSGRENIELKCLMLGFSEAEIKEMEPKIIEFAEIEKHIDQPVKTYSSGMKSRLGFATSVHINPDVLIIDEALSVGDQAFAKKCLDKINEFKKQGKTILFVSHSDAQIKQFCDKVVWLEYGRVKEYGSTNEILGNYQSFIKKFESMSNIEKETYKKIGIRGK